MGLIRIAVLGHGGVGKTCLIHQYVKGNFTSNHKPTLEDSYRHLIPLPDGSAQIVEIIDTAGTLSFPAMRRMNIESADCFIVVYSHDCDESISSAQEILAEINEIKGCRVPIMVVGNKSDVLITGTEIECEENSKGTRQSAFSAMIRAFHSSKRKLSGTFVRGSHGEEGNLDDNTKLREIVNNKTKNSPMVRRKTVSVARSNSMNSKFNSRVNPSDIVFDNGSLRKDYSNSIKPKPTMPHKCAESPSVGRSQSACTTRPTIIKRRDSGNKITIVKRSQSACSTKPVIIKRRDSHESDLSPTTSRNSSVCENDVVPWGNTYSRYTYKETSAKLNKNVDDVFRELAAKLYFQNQIEDARGWSKRLSSTLNRGMYRSVSANNFHSVKVSQESLVPPRRATTNVPPSKIEFKRIFREILSGNGDDKKLCIVM